MNARKSGTDVEKLMECIGTLVTERQTLREKRAGQRALERNRRDIADVQRRLSRALIERHLPKQGRKAA
jgi:hypothetical protein